MHEMTNKEYAAAWAIEDIAYTTAWAARTDWYLVSSTALVVLWVHYIMKCIPMGPVGNDTPDHPPVGALIP